MTTHRTRLHGEYGGREEPPAPVPCLVEVTVLDVSEARTYVCEKDAGHAGAHEAHPLAGQWRTILWTEESTIQLPGTRRRRRWPSL